MLRYNIYLFLLLMSAQSAAMDKWIVPVGKNVRTIYVQGVLASQLQGAKYCGKGGLRTTTGEHITCALGNDLMRKLGSGIMLLALPFDDRCQLLLRVSLDLIKEGFEAGKLIKEIAPIVGGSGGGKKETAQAGGSHPEKVLP